MSSLRACKARIARRCAENLAPALRGHADPLQLLFPGGSTDDAELIPAATALGRLPAEALERVPAQVRAGVLALDVPVGGNAA